nr:dienelactone hydrolase family protein [Mesorhizobium sp. PAMC28654]
MVSKLGLLKNTVLLICCGVAGYLNIVPASADQLVQFESEAVKPTPFRVLVAQKQGVVLETPSGMPLQGYLTRPQGEGPFPAVVVLHGCMGLFPSERKAWSERLSSWGYVVLFVDSFSTRGDL